MNPYVNTNLGRNMCASEVEGITSEKNGMELSFLFTATTLITIRRFFSASGKSHQ